MEPPSRHALVASENSLYKHKIMWKPLSYKNLLKRYHIRREKPQLWSFPNLQFGYIQIPKVATRSIRKAFGDSPSLAADAYSSFEAFEDDNSLHIKQDEIRHFVGDDYIFAFCRHPLSRLYSAYVNKITDAKSAGRRNIFQCHGITLDMSFSDFVKRVCLIPDHKIDRHLRSQAWFLCDSHGHLIPDYIGHLEAFADHWRELQTKIQSLSDLPHKNKGSHGSDYMSFYTPETEELARERYAADFRLLGYE